MKRVIRLLLALTVALSLAACGGSASSSAASSEAASESASEAASEPEATAAPTETPAPAVSNYFAEHGVEVLPSLPEKSPKVYYCTWQKDNPDVYAQWDDADISFSQTVEPSDEQEGYKKVTLETEVFTHLIYTGPSMQGDWRVAWSNGIYDLYTGRTLPARTTMGTDGFDYEATVTYDGQDYPVYYSKNIEWTDMGSPMVGVQSDRGIYACHQTYTFLVPEAYDGLVYGLPPKDAPSDTDADAQKDIDESESYALDDLAEGDLARATYFRFGQEA